MASTAVSGGGQEFVSSSARSIYAESYRSKNGTGNGAARKADYASSLNSDLGGAYYTTSNHTFGHGGVDNIASGSASYGGTHSRSSSMPLERNVHPYSAAAYHQDDHPNPSASALKQNNSKSAGPSTTRNSTNAPIRLNPLQQSPSQMSQAQLLRISGQQSNGNGYGSTRPVTASSTASKSRSSPSRMSSLRSAGTTTPEMTREVIVSVSGPSSRASATALAPSASAPGSGQPAHSSPYSADNQQRSGEDDNPYGQPPLSRGTSGGSVQQGRPIKRLPRPPSS